MTPNNESLLNRAGRISYAGIAWLLGLPLPIVLIALLWGGCTNW